MNETQQKNRERYPFLWPKNPNAVSEPYDYEFTVLDEMPIGWRNAFGLQMCEEIRNALLHSGGELALNLYQVEQIKEKFGYLHWYDFYGNKEVDKIVMKYEDISGRTCIQCGKPATKISTGWVRPFCDDCAEEVVRRMSSLRFIPIEEIRI